jgi:hypothetical protein
MSPVGQEHAATLEGQYIIKNLVLSSAGIVEGRRFDGGARLPHSSNISQVRLPT